MGSISLFTSTASLYNTAQTSNTAQTTEVKQAEPTEQQDSVKLSSAAQAKQLYKQGQSVATIASALGTTSKAVDDYLGITLDAAIQKTLEATSTAKA